MIYKEKGFTLYIAIMVAGSIMLGSYAVSNALFSQQRQSSVYRESQKALLAAEAGYECAEFYDFFKDAFNPEQPYIGFVECGDRLIRSGVTTVSLGDIMKIGNTTWNVMEVMVEDDDQAPCARVYVDKSNPLQTIIRSNGYNKCDKNAGRRVERTIEAIY